MALFLSPSQISGLSRILTLWSMALLLSPTFSPVSSSSSTATTRKHKGEQELDSNTGNGGGGGYGVNNYGAYPTSTLALNVPPQPQSPIGSNPNQNYNSWESQIYQTSGPAPTGPGSRPGRSPFHFINPNAFRSKGDDGINDTRGTVRYNILPNGYMAKGIVTHPADDSAPYTQANVPEVHTSSYSPQVIEDEEDEEEE